MRKKLLLIASAILVLTVNGTASLLMCSDMKEDKTCDPVACDYQNEDGDVERGICAAAPTPGPHEGSCICGEP